MASIIANDSHIRLLEQRLKPEPFFRTDKKSYLFVPYSRKLRRRVSFYRELGYYLWAHLESDLAVSIYNERVADIPIHVGEAAVASLRPTAISVDQNKKFSVHLIEQDEKTVCAWEAWANNCGVTVMNWTRSTLTAQPTWLKSVLKLLKVVSTPSYAVNSGLEAKIIAELETVRKVSVHGLLLRIGAADDSAVLRSLAQLILSKQIYSDIDTFKFAKLSELSLFNIFETQRKDNCV